jgi:hypothetical protein
MALNPLYTQDTLPTTSQAAIREFNDRYLAAIGASVPQGWADMYGVMIPTDSPEVTFPVSQLRTKYVRTEGESKYKKLGEASINIKSEEFDDGYQARLMDILKKVYAYRQWQMAPARLVLAEDQFRHTTIANLLTNATGTTLAPACVDGLSLFNSAHLANITDGSITSTWSNYESTATNILGSLANTSGPITGVAQIDYLQQEVTLGQTQVLDENGNIMGVDYDTILVPYDYYEPVKNMLAKNFLLQVTASATTPFNPAAGATDNIYKGRFNVIPVREFSVATGQTADWYLIDSKLIGEMPPWISMKMSVASSLALRVFDESSDFFKNTGNIKLSSHIWYGFGAMFPHAIRRIKGVTR